MKRRKRKLQSKVNGRQLMMMRKFMVVMPKKLSEKKEKRKRKKQGLMSPSHTASSLWAQSCIL